MKARFKVTAAEDGLVIWPAKTKLQPNRDKTYFDANCQVRGDVCGYDMHEILTALRPEQRVVEDGIYEIEVELLKFEAK